MRLLKDNFAAGGPIASLPAEWLNQVARWLNNLACTNGQVTHNFGNLIITPYGNFGGGGNAFPCVLDTVDRLDNSFAVIGRAQCVSVLGVWRDLTAGTGMTLDADRFRSGTVSGSCYVYIKIDRNAPTAPEIMRTATLPNGTDSVEYCPLYYLPYASSKITWADAVDMRHAIRLPGMA